MLSSFFSDNYILLFGDLAKNSKIDIKITKKPNSDEYDTHIQVDVEPGKPQKKLLQKKGNEPREKSD